MVNDLKELLHDNVAAPPPDHLDLDAVLGAGRRRVRGRRATVVGAASVLVAGAVTATVVTWPTSTDRVGEADRPPAPDAPTVQLSDAGQAVEGQDYEVLASYTNENLDDDNGQYFDGVTDDGLILFRDGPRADQLYPRFALMDPATGEQDWLPDLDVGQSQTWPVELGRDRLVLASGDEGNGNGLKVGFVAHVFDRATGQWSTIQWPDLPKVEFATGSMGTDGRIYVRVPATQGRIPEGGWPTSADGDAEDADAEGDTYALWSVSLADPTDVRDEGLTLGSLAFTETSMVWTDSTNGAAGLVHVRDLTTGAEHSFDPQTGDRCNLLSFGATADRVVMSQYCGTYDGGVRDDRVQILSTDGDQVVTLQDSGVDATLSAADGTSDLVVVTSYETGRDGTYLYDLDTDRFLRLTSGMSHWGLSGPAPDGQFLWQTPTDDGHGATQWLGRLLTDEG